MVHSRKLYTTTEIAKELGLKSANALNQLLEEDKIQYKVNGTWVLCSKYSDKEYVSIKQTELENLSPVNRAISERIVKSLGKEWATPKEVADYLGRHINTIYEKINNGEILSRKIGVRRVIYTPSIILIME